VKFSAGVGEENSGEMGSFYKAKLGQFVQRMGGTSRCQNECPTLKCVIRRPMTLN